MAAEPARAELLSAAGGGSADRLDGLRVLLRVPDVAQPASQPSPRDAVAAPRSIATNPRAEALWAASTRAGSETQEATDAKATLPFARPANPSRPEPSASRSTAVETESSAAASGPPTLSVVGGEAFALKLEASDAQASRGARWRAALSGLASGVFEPRSMLTTAAVLMICSLTVVMLHKRHARQARRPVAPSAVEVATQTPDQLAPPPVSMGLPDLAGQALPAPPSLDELPPAMPGVALDPAAQAAAPLADPLAVAQAPGAIAPTTNLLPPAAANAGAELPGYRQPLPASLGAAPALPNDTQQMTPAEHSPGNPLGVPMSTAAAQPAPYGASQNAWAPPSAAGAPGASPYGPMSAPPVAVAVERLPAVNAPAGYPPGAYPPAGYPPASYPQNNPAWNAPAGPHSGPSGMMRNPYYQQQPAPSAPSPNTPSPNTAPQLPPPHVRADASPHPPVYVAQRQDGASGTNAGNPSTAAANGAAALGAGVTKPEARISGIRPLEDATGATP